MTNAHALTASDRAIADRLEVTDTLYRYASSIDSFDMEALRSVLHDDLVAQYGNSPAVHGGDAVAQWIEDAISTVVWQQHLLSVYHVDVQGDEAKALIYHTSYQVFADAPDEAKQLVARYHNELRREADGWKISKLVMEICWGEIRKDVHGYLDFVGGRGPVVWPGPGES